MLEVSELGDLTNGVVGEGLDLDRFAGPRRGALGFGRGLIVGDGHGDSPAGAAHGVGLEQLGFGEFEQALARRGGFGRKAVSWL